jgi:hypothetical protein
MARDDGAKSREVESMRAERIVVSAVALSAAIAWGVPVHGCGAAQSQPAPASVPTAPPPPLQATAPVGLVIHAHLGTPLSWENARAGDPVVATLDEPIAGSDGTILVPEGARLHGTIISAEHGELDHIELHFDRVETRGQSHRIDARILTLGSATVSPTDGSRPNSTVVSLSPSAPTRLPSDMAVGGGPPADTGALEVPSDAPMQLVLERPFTLEPIAPETTTF